MKKKELLIVVLAAATMVLAGSSAMAKRFEVFERPLDLYWYLTQNVSVNLGGDHYDTEKDVQGVLSSFLLESEYYLSDELRLYASGGLTMDWIYDLKHDDRSWNTKLFSKSRDNLYVDDEFWQVLKEAHLTWTPRNFYFRIGKQIVKWGETDGFQLMDQINPTDKRRGLADVEFETSIIPIWLVRSEYYPSIDSSWIQDLGIEVIFNPNVDFIPNQTTPLGNDEGGIWAPNAEVPLGGPFPSDFMRIGSAVMNIDEPNGSEGFEYGLRLKGIVQDGIVTLNYFYGRDNSPVTLTAPVPPTITFDPDGRMIAHPTYQGYYPRFRFVGATYTKDITPLKASTLGNISPVVRLEALYAFSNTFTTTLNKFEEFDELRWALGVDWGIKIPFLNYTNSFKISPQIYHRKIMDYPSGYGVKGLQEDNYMTTLGLSTKYLHNKLVPKVFWMRDINNHADLYVMSLTYDYSDEWHYTLGGVFINGQEPGASYHVYENKDYVYFKISYKWG